MVQESSLHHIVFLYDRKAQMFSSYSRRGPLLFFILRALQLNLSPALQKMQSKCNKCQEQVAALSSMQRLSMWLRAGTCLQKCLPHTMLHVMCQAPDPGPCKPSWLSLIMSDCRRRGIHILHASAVALWWTAIVSSTACIRAAPSHAQGACSAAHLVDKGAGEAREGRVGLLARNIGHHLLVELLLLGHSPMQNEVKGSCA